jgi:hypothetical protein
MNIFEPDQIALMRAALAETANDTRPDPAPGPDGGTHSTIGREWCSH